MTGNRIRRRGVTRSKGPKAGTRPQGHWSKDKASVRGTPALTTKQMGAPNQEHLMIIQLLITLFYKKKKILIYMHKPVYRDKHCHSTPSPFLHLKLLIGL